MSSSYEKELREMVSDIIEVTSEDIALEADFINDLKVDSLKAIEIVAAFEKRYRKVIPEEDIPKIRSLGKLIDYTKNLH